MATITKDAVQQLREQTGAGVIDCKKALEESNGNLEQAIEVLRKKGEKIAANKKERAMKAGLIDAYIHAGGKVGALVEITCETDFVARTDEFKEFIHDVAMQVAAASPSYLNPEDVPQEIINKEREIFIEQCKQENKPKEIMDKIVNGKVEKYFQEVCLLKQPFIKDDKITIEKLLTQKIAKIGENIQIVKFIRFSL